MRQILTRPLTPTRSLSTKMLSRSLLTRPSRGTPLRLPKPSTSTYQVVHTRNVVSVAPPVEYSKKTGPRRYSERKNFMVNQYTRLLESSKSSPLIFFHHVDFSVQRLIQLRKDIANAAAKAAAPSLGALTPGPVTEPPPAPKFTVVSTNFFGVALRNYSPMDVKTVKSMADMVEGGLAVMSFQDFNPPQLDAVLRALARSVPVRKPKTPEQLAQEAKDAADAFVPGRRPKRQRPTPVPDLKVVGALIEGRLFMAADVQTVAKLPTLDVLRAQIVGLLSAPASQLAAVLSEASGGKLARTLEGLKKSLEEQEAPPSESS